MRRVWIVVGAIVAVLVLVGGLTLWLAKDSIDMFVQDRFYDSVPSAVACADLPSLAAVEKAIVSKPVLVQRLQAVGGKPDVVTVLADDTRCGHTDHAEILILYPGHEERLRIEAILKRDGFGVPVALRNV
jgi:hypothetical protein